jgi:hypothetical protein
MRSEHLHDWRVSWPDGERRAGMLPGRASEPTPVMSPPAGGLLGRKKTGPATLLLFGPERG